jgi:sugar/nucleoside kinase (ribokinase family)
MFLHCPGCNDTFGPEDLHDDTLESTRHLHFGYPSLMKRMYQNDGEELEELLKQAKAFGVTTSLDLSFPDPESEAGKADWRKILSRALPYTDLFLPSVEELLFMIRREDYDRLSAKGDVLRELRDDSIYGLANEALSMGASVVALKAGDRGVYLRTADKFGGEMGRSRPANPDIWQGLSLHEEVYDVEVEGTAGSGDTTIAGFLYGWINGYPPERALQIATAVGAFCCEAADAVSGVRTWEETQQRIESGWRKLQV